MDSMNEELWKKAEVLAARPYSMSIEEDTLADDEVVYVVRHPELVGCKAFGTTIDEAKANLDDARLDYIYALLVQGLEVPSPSTSQTMLDVIPLEVQIDASNTEREDEPAQPHHRIEIGDTAFFPE